MIKLDIQMFGGRGATSNTKTLSDYKTQTEKLNYLTQKYKDKLAYPIEKIKVKKYWTGDQKTGKYDWQYNARTKSGQDIMVMNNLEKLEERLKKAMYK